jgi:U3 small nucleolar RNA-associated protein 14
MESDDDFIETNPNAEYEEQDEDIEFKHKNLLEKISDLNQPDNVKRKRVRTEPRDIHELNLLKRTDEKLDLKQLLDKVTDSTNNEIVSSIKKFSKKVNRKKVLNAPLEKVHKDRLERKVLFEETSKEVSKWEPIVLQNRVADQLTFPLKEPELKLESNEQIIKKFKPKLDFEKEINELLKSSENYLNDEQPLTEAEEKALSAMSIEEAKAKHRELR